MRLHGMRVRLRLRIGGGAYDNGVGEETHKRTGSFGDRGEFLMDMPTGWVMWSRWGSGWFGIGDCPFSSSRGSGVDGSKSCCL